MSQGRELLIITQCYDGMIHAMVNDVVAYKSETWKWVGIGVGGGNNCTGIAGGEEE